jgi:acyl-CoA hydrolase
MSDNFWKNKQVQHEDPTVGHSIAYSATITSRLMELLDSNARGNVHGGVIMRMVDESAAIVAIKHSHRGVVTARIDRMDFIAPVFVGEVVTVYCALNYVGRTSMEVGVEVTAEKPRTGEIRKVVSSQLVFVAMDDNRHPANVPPLLPANEDEKLRMDRARIRRERLKRIEEELGELGNTK